MRRILLCLWLLLAAAPGVAADERGSGAHRSDAVLINVTEEHLNHILRSAATTRGWTRVAGYDPEASGGVYDLDYSAEFSQPVLTLDENGSARVDFDLQELELRVGRFERKVAKLPLRCDDLGVRVEPDNPLDLSLAFRLGVEEGALRFHADDVHLASRKKDIRLIKPARCHHALFPRWLVWWLGKSRLRKQVGRLEGKLLERADEVATEINEDGDLLHERWKFGTKEIHLYPSTLDTDRGSLLIGMGLSGAEGVAGPSRSLDSITDRRDRSFVALSHRFLNTFLRLAMSELHGGLRQPGKQLSRLLRSDAFRALMPGLQELESPEKLRFALQLREPPRIELWAPDHLCIRLEAIDVEFWEPGVPQPRLHGTMRIDSARLGVVPYANAVGGVSFNLVENEWAVSALGFEQNVELLEATLQELVFGEAFETRYRPLVRNGVEIGSAAFRPNSFRVVGEYLLIEVRPRAVVQANR